MITPKDSEIREYASYYIRALSIFKEEFKNFQGRLPTEAELQDFSRMGIIPFGILKQNGQQKSIQDQQQISSDGPKNEDKSASQTLQANQPAKQDPKITAVMEIIKAHPELSLEGNKIIFKKQIEPKEVYFEVRDELERRGWKYIPAKKIGGEKWEPGHFEMEGAKA